MTSARQQRKSALALGLALGFAAIAAFLVSLRWWVQLFLRMVLSVRYRLIILGKQHVPRTVCGGIFAPAPTDRILVDAHTGLANSGFDPVAYFTDDKPKIGRPDLELRADGTIWRFKNEGNRAAFADHPEVYMPRFGGYDPVAIARGEPS